MRWWRRIRYDRRTRRGDGGGDGAAGAVTVGSGIQYVSGRNGSMNPAVDTIPVGATVTWTWTGTLPHGVRSVGTPSFVSSETHTGSGTYVATFSTAGTYKYDCSVHGQGMTGTIVVVPASSQSRGSIHDAAASLVDLDLDRSPATGSSAVVDELRPDGRSTAPGAHAPIAFTGSAPAGGHLTVLASSHDPLPELDR